MTTRVILDLCGGTGAWSRPYVEAGYDVRLITLPKHDVRTYELDGEHIHGILAAPPCTEFASSGARWWASKPEYLLCEALQIVKACLAVIKSAQPQWWALENPVGRLPRFIGPYRYTFQPYEYGDPWTKRSCIWGEHIKPTRRPIAISKDRPSYGNRNRNIGWKSGWQKLQPDELHEAARLGMLPSDWVHRLGPSPDRAVLRSITPPGFARAFFEANP